MVHDKLFFSLIWVVGLSFWLTSVSAESYEKQEWEKKERSIEKNNVEQSQGVRDRVEFGPAEVDYVINAKKLIGTNIVSRDGKKLGEIDDLILSGKDKVAHVIASVGGVLGIGDKSVAIPFRDINIRQDEAVTNLSEQQLKQAPEFKVDDSAGNQSGQNRIDYDINAKKLFDFDVVDRGGKKLGDINDLVLSQDDKVAYALVSVGGLLGIGEKLVAVPYANLQLNKADEKVLLNVTKEQLEQAPAFRLRNQ